MTRERSDLPSTQTLTLNPPQYLSDAGRKEHPIMISAALPTVEV